MKLAIVRQRYSPFGGAERFISRALPALERAGVDVTLLTRKDEGWGARQYLKIDPLYVGNLWRDWSFEHAARRTWRRYGFDLVQSHERIPGCDVFRAGDGVHRRWLEMRSSSAGIAERLGIALNPHHRYLCAAEKAMFEHPRLRAVICNSNMVRDEIRRAFRIEAGKLHVIQNGVDLEHFNPRLKKSMRGKMRAELGCSPRDTLFLYVGGGFARKGLAAAIDALAACANEGFWLLVVGRDRDAAAFTGRARAAGLERRVRFLGAQEEVRPLYAAADCFILPSRYDPFPNTALEALAMGLPAIVSSKSGAAEIIEPGVNGWICDPDDVPGIARLMREADQALRTERSAREARATAERFGIDAMAAKLVELYKKLDGQR